MKVSFRVSVHNSEETIARSIESLLKKAADNFSRFVVDDGSTDATGEILVGMARLSSRCDW